MGPGANEKGAPGVIITKLLAEKQEIRHSKVRVLIVSSQSLLFG